MPRKMGQNGAGGGFWGEMLCTRALIKLAGLGLIGIGGYALRDAVSRYKAGEGFNYAYWSIPMILGTVMVNPPEICRRTCPAPTAVSPYARPA